MYDKLSEKEKLKKVHSPCRTAVRQKLDTITLAKNPFFDKDVFPYLKGKYNEVFKQYRDKVVRYSEEHGVTNTQTSTCAFIDQLITKAKENLLIRFKSVEYRQPRGSHKKLQCPVENSVQQLETVMDLAEGVELISKQAELKWPNDEPLQTFLKRRKTELYFTTRDYSSRAKTHLDMAKNVNDQVLHLYEKNSALAQDVQDLNEENKSTVGDDNESVQSITNQSVANNSDGNDLSSDENETHLKEIPIYDRNAYVRPLDDTLKIFNNKREQSENHLNSPIEGKTNYGFITSENRDLNFQETHDFFFREDKIDLNTGLNILKPRQKTQFVDSFYDENSMKRSISGEILTPEAQTAIDSIASKFQ